MIKGADLRRLLVERPFGGEWFIDCDPSSALALAADYPCDIPDDYEYDDFEYVMVSAHPPFSVSSSNGARVYLGDGVAIGSDLIKAMNEPPVPAPPVARYEGGVSRFDFLKQKVRSLSDEDLAHIITGSELTQSLFCVGMSERGAMLDVMRRRIELRQKSKPRRLGLDRLAAKIAAWQAVTFPLATAKSTAEHLRREAVELAASPLDAEEMADVFHMLIAVAGKAGVDLAEAVARKFEKNLKREWGQPDADGVVEHKR